MRWWNVVCVLSMVMVVWAGGAAAVAADEAPGGDLLLSSYSGDDVDAAMAYSDGDGLFLTVWIHEGKLHGQLHDWQGVPQGGDILISDAANGRYEPDVVFSAANNVFLVVWEDLRNGQDLDVYGQFVGADGALVDNPSTVAVETDPGVNFAIATGAGHQAQPALAVGPGRLVVWQTDATGTDAIAGCFLSGSGAVGTSLDVASGGGLARVEPTAAYGAGSTEYMVAYQTGEGAGAEIRARRIDATSEAPVGSEFTVAAQPNAEGAAIAGTQDVDFMLAWADNRGTATGVDIYGRLVTGGADGVFDGGEFPIAVASYPQRDAALVASVISSEYLAFWTEGRPGDETGWNVYGQRLLHDGTLVEPAFPVAAGYGDQRVPAAALAHGSGSQPSLALVAWEDRLGGHSDIVAQRLALTGDPLAGEFTISAQPELQFSPAVAYNEDDEQYLAVWVDVTLSEAGGEVYGQRIAASDGRPLEEPWMIEATETNEEPAVVYISGQGAYLVVWADNAGERLEGARVYPAGGLVERVNIAGGEGGRAPSLAYDPGLDHVLVTWSAGEEDEEDIFARIFSGEGEPVFPVQTICAATGEQLWPDAGFAPGVGVSDGRFFIVWQDERTGGDHAIYGRRLSTLGLLGGEVGVAGHDDAVRRDEPAIAYNDSADEYMVVYNYVQSPSNVDIYGQRVTPEGLTSGVEQVVWSSAADQLTADVIYVPTVDRYFVVWEDARDPVNLKDLWGRWLAADGSVASGGLPVFRYPGHQWTPALAADADRDQALLVWCDTRRTFYDIHGELGALDVTPPVARFRRAPWVGSVGETFTFNAAPSSDDLTPSGALAVRWDWTSDGSWDTDWSTIKVATRTLTTPGVTTVTLEVRDAMWYTDTASQAVVVTSTAGTPPTASFEIDPVLTVAGTAVAFDGTASTDAETPDGLVGCWDWTFDGTCDTAPSASLTGTHAYTQTGLRVAGLVVADVSGLTDVTARLLLVLPDDAVTLTVAPRMAALVPGEGLAFEALAWDEYGNRASAKGVSWTLQASAAGTLDATGIFTAGTATGEYTDAIEASLDGLSDSASVMIVWPVDAFLPLVLRG